MFAYLKPACWERFSLYNNKYTIQISFPEKVLLPTEIWAKLLNKIAIPISETIVVFPDVLLEMKERFLLDITKNSLIFAL